MNPCSRRADVSRSVAQEAGEIASRDRPLDDTLPLDEGEHIVLYGDIPLHTSLEMKGERTNEGGIELNDLDLV